MRILVRTVAIAAPLIAIAAGLFAADYTITVSVDNKGKIGYHHTKGGGGKSHGAKGHQVVAPGEKITWVCDKTCKNPTVQFKTDNPCMNPTPTTCVAGDYFGIFPYSIAVMNQAGGIVMHDPDVIVDNGGER
jgi:hypothetical protein